MAVEHPVEWRQSSYRCQSECLTAGYGSRPGEDGGLTPATGKPSSAQINRHQAEQALLSKIFGCLLIALAHGSPAPPQQTAQRHGSKTCFMKKGNGKGRRSSRPSMATHLCSGESCARLRPRKVCVGSRINFAYFSNHWKKKAVTSARSGSRAEAKVEYLLVTAKALALPESQALPKTIKSPWQSRDQIKNLVYKYIWTKYSFMHSLNTDSIELLKV